MQHLPEFQKGLITEPEFWQKICTALTVPTPQLKSLWGNAFRSAYSPKPEMFNLAASLQSRGYKTALLSNTEVPAMEYFLKQNYKMFDALVFSCHETTHKPEEKIYKLVLDKLDVEPSEAIFIDDRPDYIRGADRVGLGTIWFRSPADVVRLLAEFSIYVGQ